MTRTTHDRLNDHFGEDSDYNVVLDGATLTYLDGTPLHTVISDIDDRIAGTLDAIVGQAGTVNFIVGGTPGIAGDVVMGFDGYWTEWDVLATISGSIVIDVWKDSYANFPPVVGDSITASAKPTISGGVSARDTTLTGWTKAFSAGDVLRINVDSATTITQATLALWFHRPIGYFSTISDSLTTSDTAARTGTFVRTATDGVTTSDTAVAVVT